MNKPNQEVEGVSADVSYNLTLTVTLWENGPHKVCVDKEQRKALQSQHPLKIRVTGERSKLLSPMFLGGSCTRGTFLNDLFDKAMFLSVVEQTCHPVKLSFTGSAC